MICVLGCGKEGKWPVQVSEHAVVPCAACCPTGTGGSSVGVFKSTPKFVEQDVSPALRNILDPGMMSSVADPGSRIRCFFDPWIRDGKNPDPGWKNSDPGWTSWICNTDGVRGVWVRIRCIYPKRTWTFIQLLYSWIGYFRISKVYALIINIFRTLILTWEYFT